MKKAFSKSLSWLLSVVMIFGVFIVPTSIQVSATQSRKDYFNKNYSVVSGDPGQTIVNIAKAQIGKTGNDLPYGEDWCADFVSDCADLAGQSAAVPRRGNVDDLTYAVIKIGGGKQYWNESEAKPGDLVFYDGSDMNGSPNHVEIVAYVSGGKIYSIGGNTGNIYSCYNSVVSNVRQYYPTNRFLYFIRPNYKNTNIDVKVDVGTNFYAQIIHDGKALTQINRNVVLSTTTGAQNQLWYFERTDGLYYKITNVGNFEVLDAANQATANGTNVGTCQDYNNDAQRWCFIKSGGNLTIVPKYSSNIAVDLNGGNMADGTNIQLWERNGSFAQAYVIITPTYNDTKIDVGTNFYAMICHNGKVLAESNGNVVLATETRADQQMWYFEKDSNLNYKITNVKSKKCLDVAGGGTTYGTNVGTYESNNTDAQRWYFVKSGGNLIIVPKLSSNIALDLCGGMEDGSNIQIWGRNGTFAQEYVLITPTYTVSYDMNGGSGSISNKTKTYGKDLTLSSTKPTRTGYDFLGWNTNKDATTAQYSAGGKYTANSGATLYAIWRKIEDVGTGFYAKLINTNSNKAVTVDTSNNNVYQKSDTTSDTQIWKFDKQSDGSYKITNVATNKCLDVKDAVNANGTNVQVYNDNSNSAQRWNISRTGDNYMLHPKMALSRALDVTGGSKDENINIRIWDCNTSGAEYFRIVKVTYTVAYNMNGGSGSIANQTKTYGQDLILSSTKPTRTGYDFLGWNTNKDATTAQYQPNDKYTTNSSVTLYAVWKSNTYTISYNMNGGSGSINPQIVVYGQSVTISGVIPTRAGYQFLGWNTSANATVAQYQPGSKYTSSNSVILYAIWKKLAENTPQIIVENKTASAGSEVKVNVSLKNNPGISSMGLNLKYDKTKLTLKAVNYNSAMGGQSMQPQTMDSPVILNWVSPVADYSGDGTYAELVFKVSDKAKSGTVSIEITYDSNNVYNLNDENIAFEVKNGTVTVSDYIPGDINNDGVVNNKDFSRLFQYLSGWNVVINEAALDVNGDGSVNNKDATRLFQYVSGWNVNIY